MLVAATLLLPWPAAAAEPARPRVLPRLVAEPGAARVAVPRIIRAVDRSPVEYGRVDRSPADQRLGQRLGDRPAERAAAERPQRHADRAQPERAQPERAVPARATPGSASAERRTERPRADRNLDRPAARPEAVPRHATRTPEGAATRATRHGHGRPAAQGHKPRQPRAPGSPPVLRDAPQELLPAPESLDLARATLPRSPRAACLAAARRAEQVHELPPGLLVAVAMSESSLHAHAIKLGSHSYHPRDLDRAREILAQAPRNASPMVGCVQVNARVHAKGSDWPLDPLRATDWAGGMLRRWHQETGDWVVALRRWHGGSARTEHAVLCRVRAKLEVANPDNDMLRDYACAESDVARARRAGRGILEVAEYPDRADATLLAASPAAD